MVTIPLGSFALQRLRRNLKAWYARHARDLPWRRTQDPYRIWISEIMLQQTTVAAVVPYFERFLQRFPTVHALAAAPESDVLRLWEGLGYYSRARNIHKTAQRIVAERGGEFPSEVEELHALPGIGRYTAGAIASFAFDRRAPIVEANTLRLYTRLIGYRGDPRSGEGQRLLWEFAERVLPRKSPGLFNQALMELGATLCMPSEPSCSICPLKSCCVAFAEGAQAEIPQPQNRAAITEVTEATVAVWKGDAYLLRQRQHGERWAGLWDFPRFEITAPDGLHPRRLAKELSTLTGIDANIGPQLTQLRHGVTRFRITLHCFLAEHRHGTPLGDHIRWVRPDDFAAYPFSKTGRKFANLLHRRATNPHQKDQQAFAFD